MEASYPTAADLEAFLTEAGFALSYAEIGQDLSTALDLTRAIAVGIARFENETGRHFLAASATTRTFDPPSNPNGYLDLKADLVSPTTVTLTGSGTLTLGTDYRFLPQDAPGRGEPYDRMQSSRIYYPTAFPSYWGTISITGLWAYGTTIPSDAWNGMLLAAALSRLPAIVTMLTDGALSWGEADINEARGQRPFQSLTDGWMDAYKSAVQVYKKVTVGW